MEKTVNDYTKAEYFSLKEKYDEALKKGFIHFTFQGQRVLIGYAKYLLEYLEPKFK